MRDDLLRETLHRASAHEPAVGNAFARFQRRRSRHVFLRTLVVVTLGLTAAAALARTLPGPSPVPPRFFDGPEAGAQDISVWRTYDDDVTGYRIRYPETWGVRAARPGGSVELLPSQWLEARPSVRSVNGVRTMIEPGVRVLVRATATEGTASCAAVRERSADARCPGRSVLESQIRSAARAGAAVTTSTVTLADRFTRRYAVTYGGDPTRSGVVWCEPDCRSTTYVLRWHDGWVLTVQLVGPGSEFDDYAPLAGRIISTLRALR